jgi:hypothetical protein
VAVEEVDQIGDPDAAVSARRAERGDAAVVHPLLHRARVDLQKSADLVRRQKPVGMEILLSHGFDVLAGCPVLVNVTK